MKPEDEVRDPRPAGTCSADAEAGRKLLDPEGTITYHVTGVPLGFR